MFYFLIGAALVGIAWVIWYYYEIRPQVYTGPSIVMVPRV